LTKIRPQNAEAFIASRLALGKTSATVNKDIGTLHRIFNLAIEPRGYLAEGQNPFAKLKKRKAANKPIRYVTVKEYRALMSKAKNLWWRALLSVGYNSGLRRNEILHLTWADIDFEEHRIRIAPKEQAKETIEWEPKDHEMRVVPMPQETGQLLANLQVEALEGYPYVFISRKRLKRIRERQRIGKWNSRSDVINNLGRNLASIR